MSKIVVKTSLIGNGNHHEVNSKGILKDKKIVYQDSDLQVVIEWDTSGLVLKRSCREYELEFPFILSKKTVGKYRMKQFSFVIDAEITTKKLVIKENMIIIVYELVFGGEHLGEYTYQVNYEVIK